VKRKRFSVEQITSILKQAELGTPIAELCRIHGVSEQSYYRWKKIYGGMEPSEAQTASQTRVLDFMPGVCLWDSDAPDCCFTRRESVPTRTDFAVKLA
jgi:hypothetical protein